MLANTFVVLCLRKNLIVLAVGKNEYRALYAAKEFLNYHTRRSITKHSAKHILKFLLCLLKCWYDKHTLTCTQAICLEHIRSLECLQELEPLFECSAVECLVLGSRNIMTHHETLGKILTTFKHGTSL